jgi:hypothetical protein
MKPRDLDIPDDMVLIPEESPSPFGGMTLGQGYAINSALAWLPVEVAKQDETPKEYIFGGMVMPGSFVTDPFTGVGDLRLIHLDSEDLARGYRLPRFGISRNLSAVLVRHFKVLALEPEFRVCGQCSTPVPLTEKIYDRGGLGSDWYVGFECRRCW